ncbi:MAG: hypothetical protein JWM19_7398 [Actinomycetia bacterium]|nr:hypothetical protein [Actinomycetes bacterium]
MIVPVIKQSVKLSEEAILLSGRDEPVIERLAGDLLVMYAFDLPGRFEFVARRHCEALGLVAGDLRALSVRNLVARRSKPQVKRTDQVVMLILDGDLEASLLLVDMLWDQLASKIPGDLIAAVPARDTLAVTGTGLDGGVAVLNRAARKVWDSPGGNRKLLLTPSLLIRQGNSWQLLES